MAFLLSSLSFGALVESSGFSLFSSLSLGAFVGSSEPFLSSFLSLESFVESFESFLAERVGAFLFSLRSIKVFHHGAMSDYDKISRSHSRLIGLMETKWLFEVSPF